ncbi:MAG: DNA mismatch repair protein MutS [Alphaproteobacteria bacterium]|nr:DNA mismatch repair protein MutS [Alphaproteobacteria bacterium]
MSSTLTPLMKQHRDIKKRFPDAILLFRVGDFYETFGEDAIKAAQILNITLTKRNNGYMESLELAGFPYHALDNYLHKLVKAGYRVAICDQLEDPKLAKGIVKRGVTEVVTPGLATQDKLLKTDNNFIAAIHQESNYYGLAFLDISTGDFFIAEANAQQTLNLIKNIQPAEIIINKALRTHYQSFLPKKMYFYYLEDWNFDLKFATEQILKQFKTHSLKGFGIDDYKLGAIAAGILLFYLKETEHPHLHHLNSIRLLRHDQCLRLDNFTVRNLDLIDAPFQGASLYQIINQCQTPMGCRLLKNWLLFPITNLYQINKRLVTVEFLIKQIPIKLALEELLKQIGDLERLTTKISTRKIQPRECMHLAKIIKIIHELKNILNTTNSDYFKELYAEIHTLEILEKKITETIVETPPPTRSNGGYINKNLSLELDELKALSTDGKQILQKIVQEEIIRTGINSLKIAYNKVFGYYLEVTHVHKDKVPADWIRKQTLTNAERYVTPALKEYEEKIVSADEKSLILEEQIYQDLLNFCLPYLTQLQENAQKIAIIDVLVNFATIAIDYNYTKPFLSDQKDLYIVEGRHPIIERSLPIEQVYIPNSIELNNLLQIMVITGPNMSGKSALLKQTALIIILAHIGCFVPAQSANIPITDTIFTRIGASDNQHDGESTFMVEMNEAAKIINNFTAKSLIIFDELGRGTATFDGIAIAWSIIEYLHKHTHQPKTLFATHYHEISQLEELLPRLKNYHISYKEIDNQILFLRKLLPGATMHSFGIHVAALAGMPKQIIERSNDVLNNLENKNENQLKSIKKIKPTSNELSIQLSLFDNTNDVYFNVKQELEKIDINRLTPVEALMKLGQLIKMIS